jgi:hypothetical protein
MAPALGSKMTMRMQYSNPGTPKSRQERGLRLPAPESASTLILCLLKRTHWKESII